GVAAAVNSAARQESAPKVSGPFDAGLALYKKGDYAEAARRLGAARQPGRRPPADVLYTLGRARQKAGDLTLALEAYQEADDAVGNANGRFAACRGYCLTRLRHHRDAVYQYGRARDAGYVNAVVLNNQGYSHMILAQLDEADRCLTEAIQRDPR